MGSSETEGGPAYFPASASGQAIALTGFGFALGMLSMINAEWVTLGAIGFMVAVTFSIGSVALIVGGLWDFRANNLFGATWAIAFGAFWISVGLILQFVGGGVVEAAGPEGFADAFGAYLLLWAGFTAFMAVASWFVARAAFAIFAVLVVVFVLLGIANTSAPGSLSDTLREIGGYVGLLDAALAWYLAAALVINVTADRQILPIWPYPYGDR